MSDILVVERRGSRTGKDSTDRSSTAQLIWHVSGSTDFDACRDFLKAEGYVPDIHDGLVFKSISWEHEGYDNWVFTADYVHPEVKDKREALDTGSYVFQFDTGGGTVKRTVSLATTSYPKSGETAPDFKSAIGVKDGKEVEGVEIGIPGLKFSIRKRMPRLSITLDYVITLHNMTFTKNDAAFMGFAAGELLFIGATGQEGTESDPEITFNFIASPNEDSLTVGEITGVVKPGHDYLWVLFEGTEDSSANMTVQRPKAAYVEQVYNESNFGDLGI